MSFIKLLVLSVALTVAASAIAAPRAKSSEECALLADMGIVARAHAEGGVDQDKSVAIMRRIYAEDPRSVEFMVAIERAARADKRDPKTYAGDLLQSCVRNQGVVDGFLGVAL